MGKVAMKLNAGTDSPLAPLGERVGVRGAQLIQLLRNRCLINPQNLIVLGAEFNPSPRPSPLGGERGCPSQPLRF